MDNKFARVDNADDPERCQSRGGEGQCPYKVIVKDGQLMKFCARHTPGAQRQFNYQFRPQEFAKRVQDLAMHEQVKCLREEIAIVRATLEAIVNKCGDAFEISMEFERISKLVDQINRLVVSCHKIEESSGQLLDKNIVFAIGTMVVSVVGRHIPDKAILDTVGHEIYEGIETITSRDDAERLIKT